VLKSAFSDVTLTGKKSNMETPIFVFAHGAGASSSHPWMQGWARRLAAIGAVYAFDYPYMEKGSKRPDPLPKLIAAHREALAQARHAHDGPTVLIGKSLGGRVGCHLALVEDVAAVVCLGYPLCGGGDRTRLRAEVLRALSTPVLFVQGTRDPLCPLDLLESVRREMTATNELHVVEGGDHSLVVTKGRLKASGQTQDEVDQNILEAIRHFVATNLERSLPR
jgi:predicted alpha/beta-hydrolase family hydrolase